MVQLSQLKSQKIIGFVLVLGVISLVLGQISSRTMGLSFIVQVVDFLMLALTVFEVVTSLASAPVKRNYLWYNLPSLALFVLFIVLFAYNRILVFRAVPQPAAGYSSVLIIRNVLLLLRHYTRLNKLSGFVSAMVTHPAQTVALSFLLVIAIGTLLLMMPFTTLDGQGLSIVDALFTATSAVCVTGLIVVDTATVYTVAGQIVILLLIQIGGLGIMVLSLFAFVLFRHSVTVESHLLLSYMLNESRIDELSRSLKRIVIITFTAEAIGALFLFVLFRSVATSLGHRVLLAVFHSISAFCNAGFALFTTSLEDFQGNLGINLVIAVLIIAGGLSFGVLTDLFRVGRYRFIAPSLRYRRRVERLSVNSRVVLIATGILLIVGFLGFYSLEHGRSMAEYSLGSQYLGAFFQSVTMRTAGFHTIPLDGLTTATYVMMMVIMFIGGASGSIAGGLKVNNVAVIVAFLESRRRKLSQNLIFRHSISDQQVTTAFSMLVFGLMAVFGGTFLLALTEDGSLTELMFEAVSAFATVGLSTGVTADLSDTGRLVVTVLMFIGRVGPLTLLSASTGNGKALKVRYPSAGIAVG
jgi:trk system potassium uptake protein TrkH